MTNPPYQWMNKLKIKNPILRESIAEFLGTFVLVLIGDGAFASQALSKKGVHDVFAIVYAWQLAVYAGVLTAVNITGGHINPVVTISLATIKKLPWRRVPGILIGQYLGAFLASVVLYITFYEALIHAEPHSRDVMLTGFIWTTYPEPFVSLWTVFLDSVVTVGLLMFAVMAIIDKKNANMPKWMHPIMFGCMICVLALCFGLNCMAPLNPARDLASRIFTAIAGWGSAPFEPLNYHFWWIGGLLGPHVGGIIGTWLYYVGVELHWPEEEEQKPTNSSEMKPFLKQQAEA